MKKRATILAMFFAALVMVSTATGEIIFVDADATGANDGSSWENAYDFLQDALAVAQYGDEIQVAQGIYKPILPPLPPPPWPPPPPLPTTWTNSQGAEVSLADRKATFQLVNGVSIKGGYAGLGEPDPNARDIDIYVTILCGDIGLVGINSDNSYHVVTASDTNETTVLDGLTITAGNANGAWETTNGVGGGIFNDGGKPEIQNCIINSNSATAFGGGIYNINGNLSLTDCILTSNSAYHAGGMYNKSSNPTLTNCTFSENRASSGTGGGLSSSDSNPKIINCTFIGNYAKNSGGGMSSSDNNLSLTNCMFIHNTAVVMGGGMKHSRGSLKLINCIFIKNKVIRRTNWYYGGGGVYNVSNNPTFINCTFSDNSAASDGGGGIFNNNYGLKLTNCILWRNSGGEIVNYNCKSVIINYSNVKGGQSGEGNIDADPLFVNPGEGDYRLSAGSPCIDAGDNSVVPVSLLTDLDDKARIVNGRVDMGAYERTNLGFLVSPQSISVPEGATATLTVMLAMDPLGTREAKVYRESGDPDISVESGALLTFDSSNYSQPQTVTLTAAEDEDHLNSEALFWISTSGFVVASVTATEADNEPYPDILLVDADAAGANNGSNWADAFTNLQQALSAARAIPEIDQIWVAQGIYKPHELAPPPPPPPPRDWSNYIDAAVADGDRTATFQLINGVAIKGGYAGLGEADPDARDINAYETILSGDLANNDIDVNDPYDLLNDPCRAENSYHVVTSIETDATTVLDGFTITGGNASTSSPWWDENSSGGGMYIDTGSPTVTNCTFRENAAKIDGGGICNLQGSPTINNCTITDNIAEVSGGGIACHNSTPTITNCIITGNKALYRGGGISCYPPPRPPQPPPSPVPLANADTDIYNDSASNNIIITNCILWDNESPNGPQIYLAPGSYASVNYSDVQGGWPGTGNINANPQFVDQAVSDYHLLPSSPCINTGDPAYVAKPNETDLDGNPRVIGGRIDIGAYEFFNTPPVADAGPEKIVECACNTNEGTKVTLDGTGSYDSDGDLLTYTWTGPFVERPAQGATPTVTLEDGCPGGYVITLVVNDGIEDSAPNDVMITVVDTTPPEFALSVNPTTLWPPSHQMVKITPTWMVSDNCDAMPGVSLISISINESKTRGNGRTDDDVKTGDDGSIYLRAERSGKGSDRIYTITYQAVDNSGNATVRSATVTVPHDRR